MWRQLGSAAATFAMIGAGGACKSNEPIKPAPPLRASANPPKPVEPQGLRLVSETSDAGVTRWLAEVHGWSVTTEIARVAAPFLCGYVRHDARTALLSCPERSVRLSLLDGLEIDAARVPVPASLMPFELPAEITQPSGAVCLEAERPRTVDVRIVRRREPGKPGTTWTLALLSHSLPLVSDEGSPLYCSTSLSFPKSTTFSFGCHSAEEGTSYRMTFRDGVLWLEGWLTGYHPDELMWRYGVRLPCGAAPRFHEVSHRDPRWRRFGSGCSDACFTANDNCDTRCRHSGSDDWGELLPRGVACLDRCRTALDRCTQRCQAMGQYP